jgi:hypothetical protein
MAEAWKKKKIQSDKDLEDRFQDALLVQQELYGRPLTFDERANLWETFVYPELYKKENE